MTTISYHSYREFGRKSHADNELEFDDEERILSLPVYVPYSKVRSHRVSSVVSIIDSVDRVYIRERNRVNLHKVSLKTQNEYGEIDSDEGEDNDDDENKKPDSLGSLDLGLEPLRRIVQDLHRLHSDRPHFSFDQNSAKAAGLPSYCDYLKGSGANEPRQRNTAKFQAIQQKKKVKNLSKK